MTIHCRWDDAIVTPEWNKATNEKKQSTIRHLQNHVTQHPIIKRSFRNNTYTHTNTLLYRNTICAFNTIKTQPFNEATELQNSNNRILNTGNVQYERDFFYLFFCYQSMLTLTCLAVWCLSHSLQAPLSNTNSVFNEISSSLFSLHRRLQLISNLYTFDALIWTFNAEMCVIQYLNELWKVTHDDHVTFSAEEERRKGMSSSSGGSYVDSYAYTRD